MWKKRGTAALLALVLCAAISMNHPAALAAEDDASDQSGAVQEAPAWVEPSLENGLPARIDVFTANTSCSIRSGKTVYTHTCMLCLPGGTDPADCFLSWNSGTTAAVGKTDYESGVCPVPAKGETVTYKFIDGAVENRIVLTTYRGSAGVLPVFIDIDESKGTIAAMDGDKSHETTCTGRINIAGEWYAMPKIKGRGNHTWEKSKDKRAYNITLESEIAFPGFSSPPTKKWSIISEIGDCSLLRNRVGFFLAHELGVGQETASVDVWMNGEYQGCYTITPKYDSFVAADGYLIEEDNYLERLTVAEGGDPQFELEGMTGGGSAVSHYNLITVKKIGAELLMRDGAVDDSPENLTAVSDDIRIWLQDAWDAVRSDTGFNDKGGYYSDYIDLESFAKLFLLQEYVKNFDVCAGSLFFHRDGMTDADKLIAGPLWDLDNSLGSTLNNPDLGPAGDRRSGSGAFITEMTEYKTSVYKTLWKHEDFREEVVRQYNENRAAFDSLPDVVDSMAGEIEDSARMNFQKVNMVDYNLQRYRKAVTLELGTEYEQHMLATKDFRNDWPRYVANLKTYVTARSLWFRNTYADPG